MGERGRVARDDPGVGVSVLRLDAGFGYRDNVLLAPENAVGAGFGAVGTHWDGGCATTGAGTWAWSLDGRALRYDSGAPTWGEGTVSVEGRWTSKPFGSSRWAAAAAYDFEDAVLDLSTTEDVAAGRARSHAATWETGWIWEGGAGWGAEVQGRFEREWWAEPFDSYTVGAARVEVSRAGGPGSRLLVAYEYRERRYAHRLATDVDGYEDGETRLRYHLHEVTAEWRGEAREGTHHWDWRVRARVAVNADNGAGYYDFTRWRADVRLRHRRGPWAFSVQIRATHWSYPGQREDTSDSTGGGRVHARWDLGWEGEISRRWRGGWEVFGRVEQERVLGGWDFENYTARTVLTGIRWQR